MMNDIASALDKTKVEYIRIDGTTSSETRKYLCDAFQTNDNFRVALLSIKACNTGLTLTAAQLVVFAGSLHFLLKSKIIVIIIGIFFLSSVCLHF